MKIVTTDLSRNNSRPLAKGLIQPGHMAASTGSRPRKQRETGPLSATGRFCPASATGAPKPRQANRAAGWRGQELDLAREELGAKDPVMRALTEANPNLVPCAWRAAQPVEGFFEALLFQIVGQHISVAALGVIYARPCALFPGGRPDPEFLAQIPVAAPRRIGLSTRKADYIKDLGRRAAAGELNGPAGLPHKEARNRLVSFRGIGQRNRALDG